jgi:AraC-like DNA-binding protein
MFIMTKQRNQTLSVNSIRSNKFGFIPDMMSISGLLVVLSLLGAFQGLLLAFALLSVKRGNKTANRLLAAFVFVASIVIFGGVMRTTNYVFDLPHLSRIHDPFPFLAGPLLYFYLKTLISKKTAFARMNFLHFIPFGLCVVYLIPYYFQSTADKLQNMHAERPGSTLGEWFYVRSALLIAQFLVYLFAVIWMLVKYSKQVKEKSIRVDESVHFQIKFLVISSVSLWIIGVLRYALDPTPKTSLLLLLCVGVIIYGLGYICLIKPEVVSGAGEETQLPLAKYENSNLSSQRSERYLKRLLQIMEAEKLYTDCELSLQKVAEKLSIPPRHLSQIINEQLNQSFSDFVNFYRVEEVKKNLLDPSKKHYSILAIAEDSGFNSKSSFNSVFKKHTNITPSEFRDKSSGNGKH